MKYLILLVFSFSVLINLSGQNTFIKIEKELAFYNDFFINADKADHRLNAHSIFKVLFEKTLKKENSFNYSFDSLKWLSKLTSPDTTFRVFTWQLFTSDYEVEYHGFVQTKDGSVYNLKDNKEMFSDLEYEVFSNEDWFGQMYYNLYKYTKEEKSNYILFGYKQINRFDKIKTATPIYFSNDLVYFGKEVFEDTIQVGGLKNRIVLKTISEAASKLNFDQEMGIIIYDHTVFIPMTHPLRQAHNAGASFVPDGSYHGYKWDGNKWAFIDKVFNRIDKTPPMDNSQNRNEGLFKK